MEQEWNTDVKKAAADDFCILLIVSVSGFLNVLVSI